MPKQKEVRTFRREKKSTREEYIKSHHTQQRKVAKETAKLKLIDVNQFEGMIIKLVRAHYWRIPRNIQRYFTVEDAISEMKLHVHKVINGLRPTGKQRRPNIKLSKLSTYVYSVIHKGCLGYTGLMQIQRLATEIVSLEDAQREIRAQHDESAIHIHEAREAAKRLHRLASTRLLVFLDAQLFHRSENSRVITTSQNFYQNKAEFVDLAKRTGVTIDMYRLMLQHEPPENV